VLDEVGEDYAGAGDEVFFQDPPPGCCTLPPRKLAVPWSLTTGLNGVSPPTAWLVIGALHLGQVKRWTTSAGALIASPCGPFQPHWLQTKGNSRGLVSLGEVGFRLAPAFSERGCFGSGVPAGTGGLVMVDPFKMGVEKLAVLMDRELERVDFAVVGSWVQDPFAGNVKDCPVKFNAKIPSSACHGGNGGCPASRGGVQDGFPFRGICPDEVFHQVHGLLCPVKLVAPRVGNGLEFHNAFRVLVVGVILLPNNIHSVMTGSGLPTTADWTFASFHGPL